MTENGRTTSEGGVALVTGGTGGIGGAVARAVAARGVRVVLTGRDGERAAEAAARIERETGTACLGVALDVTNPGSVDALPAAVEPFGHVEWLVNNAGFAETAPAAAPENAPLLRRMMEVNFYGPLRLFRLFGGGMLERRRGSIVQIASSAALQGYPYVSAYSSTKHALLGWSRSAALECAPKGVALSVVCPHYVDTPLTDRSIEAMQQKTGRSGEDLRAFLAAENPGGVIITPEEVAEATLALLAGERGGVVVELLGGSVRTIDEGVAVQAPDQNPS